MTNKLFNTVLVKVLCLTSIFIIANTAIAREVTFSGLVQDLNGNGIKRYVAVYRKGRPYFTVAPSINWELLGHSTSENATGRYSILSDIGDDLDVLVGVRYASPGYFRYRDVSVGVALAVSDINFSTSTTIDKTKLSAKIRLLDGGVEINYPDEVYMISLFQKSTSGEGQFVVLYNKDYRSEKNQLFDLPDGEYTLYCVLAPTSSAGIPKAASVDVVLPLSAGNLLKAIDISLQ